ncbi:deoxycytidylate deaminase [Methylobacterium sp. Leaf87]|uniref:deaminase n=1 Tax=Methylobacterium sp. Leaf87 TaxID=1736243 RepID=UPI0006F3B999|nr:deaminase [Methylobacterium sp. Leaf87]KQO69506.1 deoxycytidylate deaminase [Methylobacterium sp. Leaf87]
MSRWPVFLMQHAELAASQSKDTTQVGACLVAPDGRTSLLTSYNGPPAGVEDRPERRERPEKYLWASHAEQNLVAKAAKHGVRTEGCTVYATHHPCAACAQSLIQAGIVCVIVGPGETRMPSEQFEVASVMFAEAGVTKRWLREGSIQV